MQRLYIVRDPGTLNLFALLNMACILKFTASSKRTTGVPAIIFASQEAWRKKEGKSVPVFQGYLLTIKYNFSLYLIAKISHNHYV